MFSAFQCSLGILGILGLWVSGLRPRAAETRSASHSRYRHKWPIAWIFEQWNCNLYSYHLLSSLIGRTVASSGLTESATESFHACISAKSGGFCESSILASRAASDRPETVQHRATITSPGCSCKQKPISFCNTCFLLSFFFFLIVLQGIVITVTNIIYLVLL